MSNVTALGVDDEDFLVSSLIDRCPRTMMVRELVQNAIEAALSTTSGPKEVRIGTAKIDGVSKLRIWNTGPGMDADQLYRMCDLASSINKIKGLDRNFGMGAKVASLPSNHLGMRYRSCSAGRVHEIIIGKRDGIYGRILRPPPGRAYRRLAERLVDLVEVTQEVVAEGISVAEDWTEVVLLGMKPEQDTSTDPYHGEPAMQPYWLPEVLYHRYFDMPADVLVHIEPGLQWFSDMRRFLPLKQRVGSAFANHEAVDCGDGIRVHYLFDPQHPKRNWENGSSEGALQTSASLAAVVWRGEMYDVLTGSPWYYEAPTYGFTFGGRHFSVLIELTEDVPVTPDGYRQFLRYGNGHQSQVRTKDFVAVVRNNMPAWVSKIARKTDDNTDLNASIISDLSRLAIKLQLVRPATPADLKGQKRPGQGKPGAPAAKGAFAGTRRACGVEPVLLRDASDMRDRWLEGRAGCFYPETNQLFINMLYEPLAEFQTQLTEATSAFGETGAVKKQVVEVSEALFVRRLVRAVLFGLSKRLNQRNWKDGHIEKAMSPEALSLIADDVSEALPEALALIRDRMSQKPMMASKA